MGWNEDPSTSSQVALKCFLIVAIHSPGVLWPSTAQTALLANTHKKNCLKSLLFEDMTDLHRVQEHHISALTHRTSLWASGLLQPERPSPPSWFLHRLHTQIHKGQSTALQPKCKLVLHICKLNKNNIPSVIPWQIWYILRLAVPQLKDNRVLPFYNKSSSFKKIIF